MQDKHGCHEHGCSCGDAEQYSGFERKWLWQALGVIALIAAGQGIGGYLANSYAIIADTVHVATDGTAILIALAAGYFAVKNKWPRARDWAAVVNGALLLLVGTYIYAKALGTCFPGATALTRILISLLAVIYVLPLSEWGATNNVVAKRRGMEFTHKILINGTLVLFLSGLLLMLTRDRWFTPTDIKPWMWAVATGGFLGNLWQLKILHGVSIGEFFRWNFIISIVKTFLFQKIDSQNLNLTGVQLHVISDTFSSAAVIMGGLAIYLFDFYILDPILAIFISFLIIRCGLKLIGKSIKKLRSS